MDMKIDLVIKPFEKSGIVHTHVRAYVEYDKNVKGPVAQFQTARIESDGPFETMKMALLSSPSTRVVMERGWKSNNKKRLAAAFDQLQVEIHGKHGESYAALVKMLKESCGGDGSYEMAEPLVAG